MVKLSGETSGIRAITRVHGFSAVARRSATCDKPSSKNSQLIGNFFLDFCSSQLRPIFANCGSLNRPFLFGEFNVGRGSTKALIIDHRLLVIDHTYAVSNYFVSDNVMLEFVLWL